MRVFPNLYPAFVDPAPPVQSQGCLGALPALGRHEVVVHAPRHVISLAHLSNEELAGVATAWRARAATAREAGFAYVHAFVNEGRGAGASRAHSHSQLVWLAELPPALLTEPQGDCALCGLLAAERAAGARVVGEKNGLVCICPYASRAPYELLVAPNACEPDAFSSEQLAPALALVAEALRRLTTAVGPAPLNLWLRTAPFGRDAPHWHLVVLPRLTVPAGLELGAEIYVNTVPPEDAAADLRSTT